MRRRWRRGWSTSRVSGCSGARLEELNAEPARAARRVAGPPIGQALFSDLNQWMLKVLLAPELPDTLLSAPRGRYRNASQLAAAANVSVMSAFRFVRQLQLEGHLEEAAPSLSVVRREELFSRWHAASSGRVEEVPMRFLLGGEAPSQLRHLLSGERACLGLFAAADALGLGLVSGVPPHVYVPRLNVANVAAWGASSRLVPASNRTFSCGGPGPRSRCFVESCARTVWQRAMCCRSGWTCPAIPHVAGSRRRTSGGACSSL